MNLSSLMVRKKGKKNTTKAKGKSGSRKARLMTSQELISRFPLEKHKFYNYVPCKEIIHGFIRDIATLYNLQSLVKKRRLIDQYISKGDFEEAHELLEKQESALSLFAQKAKEQEVIYINSAANKIKDIKNSLEENYQKSELSQLEQEYEEIVNGFAEKAKALFQKYPKDLNIDEIESQSKRTIDQLNGLKNSIRDLYFYDIGFLQEPISTKQYLTSTISNLKEKRNFDPDFWTKIISRQRSAILNRRKQTADKVEWKALPTGLSWKELDQYIERRLKQVYMTQNEKKEFKARLQTIHQLSPSKIFQGVLTFKNYYALIFNQTRKVVLESLQYGNAIYIFDGDWISLSQRSKQSLLRDNMVTRIRHDGFWRSKLKRALKL